MVAITVLFLFIAAVLAGIGAKQWNLQKSFAWISTFPPVLFLGSLAGLRNDSNSWLFFEMFVLSLLFSVVVVGLGVGILVLRMKGKSPVRREVALTVLACLPDGLRRVEAGVLTSFWNFSKSVVSRERAARFRFSCPR